MPYVLDIEMFQLKINLTANDMFLLAPIFIISNNCQIYFSWFTFIVCHHAKPVQSADVLIRNFICGYVQFIEKLGNNISV